MEVRKTDLSPGQAGTFIIYRPDTSFHKYNSEEPFVYLDEEQIGTLGVGETITVRVAPGRHEVRIKSSFLFLPGFEAGRVEFALDPKEKEHIRYGRPDPRVALWNLREEGVDLILPLATDLFPHSEATGAGMRRLCTTLKASAPLEQPQ